MNTYMRTTRDIVGWTADAEVWCDYCAWEAYGPEHDERKDRAGNDVHPIFAWDECNDEVCGDCGEGLWWQTMLWK